MLRSNKELQVQCAVEVHNRFQPLQDVNESTMDRHEKFARANEEVAKKVIPIRKRNRRAGYYSEPRVTKDRDEVSRAYDAY